MILDHPIKDAHCIEFRAFYINIYFHNEYARTLNFYFVVMKWKKIYL
jgi:hypothetical protein